MSLPLKRELEILLDAYSDEAPEDATYPYKVFNTKRVGADDGVQKYILEVNVWDQGSYYSKAEAIMDELEQKLHRCNHLNKFGLICCFKGQRQNVPDPDKSIKRVREQFDLTVVEREE